MAVCNFIVAFFRDMSVPMFIGICVVIYIGMYMNYGIIFSMMGEGGVPTNVAGTAIGVVCTLGYLPEVICPMLAGHILDTYSETGYKYYFIGVGIVLLIGIVGLMLWRRYLKDTGQKES